VHRLAPQKQLESNVSWGLGPCVSDTGCERLIGRKIKRVGHEFTPHGILRHEAHDSTRRWCGPGCTITGEKFFPSGITVVEYLADLHLSFSRLLPLRAAAVDSGSGGSRVRAIAVLDD